MPDVQSIRTRLTRFGQEHLLAFLDGLTAARRDELLRQIDQLDLEQLSGLIRTHVKAEPRVEIPAKIEPPDILPADPRDKKTRDRYARAVQRGEELLGQGKVAAFVVAGGQGTRLGYDGPKGCLAVTPVKRKSRSFRSSPSRSSPPGAAMAGRSRGTS